VQKKDRVLIDYSTEGLESRNTDIRLRATNHVPEIVIKTGKLGGSDERRELSVLTRKNNFDNLVKAFAVLGLRKGILCVRKGNIYKYKDIEFSVVEVPNHSYYFEVEKLIRDNKYKNAAKQELMKMCKKLNLRVFTDKGLFSYLRKLNSEANEMFDFINYTDNYFKQRFNL
jgi:predicted adenylyl cyclase CyaB